MQKPHLDFKTDFSKDERAVKLLEDLEKVRSSPLHEVLPSDMLISYMHYETILNEVEYLERNPDFRKIVEYKHYLSYVIDVSTESNIHLPSSEVYKLYEDGANAYKHAYKRITELYNLEKEKNELSLAGLKKLSFNQDDFFAIKELVNFYSSGYIDQLLILANKINGVCRFENCAVEDIHIYLTNMLSHLVYTLKVNSCDKLIAEREEYAINIQDEGQKAYFKNFYDGKVSSAVEHFSTLITLVVNLDLYFKTYGGDKITISDFKSLTEEWYKDYKCYESETTVLLSTTSLNKTGTNLKNTDPFIFINPNYVEQFKEAENKATGGTGEFETNIRCAAFCEILYSIGYITKGSVNEKHKSRVRMNNFSESKYGINIMNSLGNKTLRDKNIYHPQNGKGPLKNCFTTKEFSSYESKKKM